MRRGDTIRDCVTQGSATIIQVSFSETDDGLFPIYHLDNSIPDNADYPHRRRLESEIAPADFIGPLEPPFGFFGLQLDGDQIVASKPQRLQ